MSRYHKSRSRRWATQTASLLTGGLLAAALAGPASALPRDVIRGEVPDLVSTSQVMGNLAADQKLSVSITLPIRNKVALDNLLEGLNNPSDARYGHYLTPTDFGKQFGPTQAQYDSVVAYAKSNGLTVTTTSPARTFLTLSGTAAQVNAAFGVTLKQFKASDGRVFHAPDTEVRVPNPLGSSILAVTGLDDATPPRPLSHLMRRVSEAEVKAWKASTNATPLVQNPGEQGTGPGGGFSPADLRTAYGLNGTSLNGAGQTIAMVEYGTKYNTKDALKYENQFGLPRVPLAIVNVDGGPTVYTGASVETDLDVDMQLAMAPGAKQILVFLQGSTGSTLDAINAVYTDGRAKQLSISYGFGAESRTATTPSATQQALQTAYLQLATAGVSVYVSSGDGGSAPGGTRTYIDISSDEPSVCCVGGTALTVQTPGVNETYKAESTWNYDGTAADGAGGGGVSKQWTIAGNATYAGATYQANAATSASAVTGSNVSATMRNVPDISCVASPETGVAIYQSTDPAESPGWIVEGGTSASAPLWAGFTALINQNRALNGMTGTLGLPNTSLYPLAYTSAGLTGNYAAIFHDINDGSSNLTLTGGTNYKAVTGYDASTGLGSMQGVNLITALSGPTPAATGGGHGGG